MSYDKDNDLQLEDVEDYSADYPPPSSEMYSTNETNMAPAGDDNNFGEETNNGKNKPNYRRAAIIGLLRENKWTFAVFGVVLIVLIGVLSATVGKSGSKSSDTYLKPSSNTKNNDGNDSSGGGGVPPIYVEPESVDQDVLAVLKSSLENTYDRHNLDKSLLESYTPQRQAMLFLAKDVSVNSMEHTEKLQRFFLAVFFYSTNKVPSVHVEDPGAWKVADNWMSNAHSCDWMGVECNEDKVITSMFLERNRLSGKIPVDIAIIANNIEKLDFTDNIMHMREGDFDAFASLKNLNTLLMDDNYLFHDEGLPPQFGAMTNLEKIRLSYNLFEGDLDDHETPILGAMTKLTHLEMESNYFTGGFPNAIATMDQLTYCYLRRNNMSFNFDFIKSGQFKDNMFAMWLDGNAITGTIPTEIGLMTGLASFSAANATLTGTIPEEIGNLNQLRRLWLFNNGLSGNIPESLNKLDLLEVVELHGNKLEGDMPQGVCSAVDNSDYEYKSLTSDCKKAVTCATPECCTQCF